MEEMEEKQADGRSVPIETAFRHIFALLDEVRVSWCECSFILVDMTPDLEELTARIGQIFGEVSTALAEPLERVIGTFSELYDMMEDFADIDANLDHIEKAEEMNRRERDALRWRNEASRAAAYTRRRRDPPIKKRFRRYQGRRKCGHR